MSEIIDISVSLSQMGTMEKCKTFVSCLKTQTWVLDSSNKEHSTNVQIIKRVYWNPPNMFLLKVSLTIVYQEKRMLFQKRIGYLSKNNPRFDKL